MATAVQSEAKGHELDLLLQAILQADKIATHRRPDMDALMALCLVQLVRKQHHKPLKREDIVFLNASVTGVEKGILAVDMDKGYGLHPFGEGLAIKATENASACLSLLPLLDEGDQSILYAPVSAISDADLKGKNIYEVLLRREDRHGMSAWNNLHLRNQAKSMSRWDVYHSLMLSLSDEEVLDIFCIDVDNMLRRGRERMEAKQLASEAEYLCDGKLAILPFNAHQATSTAAFNRGAEVVLFSGKGSYKDEYRLGLAKSHSSKLDLYQIFWGHMNCVYPDIWLHPDGFMLGWTGKGPLICKREEFEKKREEFKAIVLFSLSRYFKRDQGR